MNTSICEHTRAFWIWGSASAFCLLLTGPDDVTAGAAEPIRFTKNVVDRTFRSEGVAVADVNRDGKTDILAGDVWYEAPNWTKHEIRPAGQYIAVTAQTSGEADGRKFYSRCVSNWAADVNVDGWVDSIVVDFLDEPCWWYENPKGLPGCWKEHLIEQVTHNESPLFTDLLGTGRPGVLTGCQRDGKWRLAWYRAPSEGELPWRHHVVGAPSGKPTIHRRTKQPIYAAPGARGHGLGVGDINGDGRTDVVTAGGWYEAPSSLSPQPWPFRSAPFAAQYAHMLVYDVDGDGDNDVIASSAHRYGMWWFEQTREDGGIEFRRHDIPCSVSQLHALVLADINGDGLQDVVAGKRYLAHRGRDPGWNEPAVLFWLELRRSSDGQIQFVSHCIDDDSGVGTQLEVADLNGDGMLDVITSNKKGTCIFVQNR